MTRIVKAIHEIFNANSIAVIGASTNPRKYGYMTLDSLIRGGYEGKIYPINPRGGELLGLKVYSNLNSVPSRIDLAVIIVPAELVPTVLVEAADKGVRGAVILSGGFREAGRPDLEVEIAEISHKHNIRVMGPNIQGVNYLPNKMCIMFFPVIKTKGPVAIISQSGSFTAALSEWAADEGLGISAAINLGNQVDLCESDYIEFFAADEHTKALILYLEGVKDARRFLKVLEQTTSKKPVCILKAGRTVEGQQCAASHTGSLAGKHEVFSAACRQLGAFDAPDLETLYDAAKILSTLPPSKGNRVMIISTSGGIGVLAADELKSSGLTFPPLQKKLIQELKKVGMPPLAVLSNPLDLVSIQAEYFEKAVLAADKMDAADVFLLGFGDPVASGSEMVKRLALKIKGRIAVTYLGGGEEEKVGRVELQEAGIPVFPTPERAIRGIDALVKFQSRTTETEFSIKDEARLGKNGTFTEKSDSAGSFILEPEAAKYLKQLGIPYPEHGVAKSSNEAVAISDRIGYPVVLKIVSPDILHKSEVDGVTLGLNTSEKVREGYDRMVSSIKSKVSNVQIDGVMVCKEAEKGIEVIVGALNDSVFGPTIMFGAGGIYAELYQDVAFRIAPLRQIDALEMVQEIKSFPLLSGFRGGTPRDIKKLTELIMNISRLMTKNQNIKEMDLNPVRVYGQGIMVLDVRIVEFNTTYTTD